LLLKKWNMSQTDLEVHQSSLSSSSSNNTIGQDPPPKMPLIIRTADGVRRILRQPQTLGPETELQPSLSLAIEQDQSIRLTIKPSKKPISSSSSLESNNNDNNKSSPGAGIMCELWLSIDKALQIGNPNHVPTDCKRQKQTEKHPLRVLQQTLGSLLDDTLLADIVLHKKKSSDITAKQVYALVDNLQYNNSKDTPAESKIPGLVPTLRPYQQAAVQWMLRREQCYQTSGREWELVWMQVVIQLNDEDDDDLSCSFLPLYELSSSDLKSATPRYLYCPFTGWWADSYDSAKAMTLTQQQHTANFCKGGILAESMGLGKTVELLACVLSHRARVYDDPPPPLPENSSATDTATAPSVASVVASVAPVEGSSNTTTTATSNTTVARENSTVSPSADDCASSSSSEEEFEFDSAQQGSESAATATAPKHDCVVVVEERDHPHPTSPVGICICGQAIRLNEPSRVVLCESCHEPMHATCAGWNDDDDGPVKKKRIVYRYGTSTLDCTVCSKDLCPCCFANTEAVTSRATLIITPPAILNQWQREIHRHTEMIRDERTKELRPLKVITYPGIRSLCDPNRPKHRRDADVQLIHPRRLADADIVLMTFDGLLSDLSHSDDNPFVKNNNSGGRSLRQRKLYRVVPSPLLPIHWWRVCLDEAQRVETPTAASARMALKLKSTHRWCVSGTPVGRGKMDDLYGLLLFLRLDPFASKQWFHACFHSQHRDVSGRIKHLLRDVLWRSTKASLTIREQMGVPEQIEEKVLLEFSSIEKHFYRQQLEETLVVASDVAQNEKMGKKRKLSQLDTLSTRLHRLRAACCHPQVGSSGLGRTKRRKPGRLKPHGQSEDSYNNDSRILTMDQVLDRLIDDAKLKCEEAQRLCLMHTNAMGALSKLKVEAKDRGASIAESNERLLVQSCKLYLESLKTIEENSKPDRVIGEAITTGCIGFRSSRKLFRNGYTVLDWQLQDFDDENDTANPRELCSRIDFEGPSKRIRQVKVRPRCSIPPDLADETKNEDSWHLLFPKTCIFQVASAAVGGEFVDILSFDLPRPSTDNANGENEWFSRGGFRTNKSRSWRFVVENYHNPAPAQATKKFYCGLEVELFEATIGGDSLQRLHALHNASLSFNSLIQFREIHSDEKEQERINFLSNKEMHSQVKSMIDESANIERLYMDGILPVHTESQRLLRVAVEECEKIENELFELARKASSKGKRLEDCWDDEWWSDILAMCLQFGLPREQLELCRRVHEDLNSAMEGAYDRKALKSKAFPAFNDVNGLFHAVNIRAQELRCTILPGGFSKCVKEFQSFSTEPNEAAILESSTCERCKRDWTWKGPMCAHCRLSVNFGSLVSDRLLSLVLGAIQGWMKGGRSTSSLAGARATARVDERANKFFAVLEAEKKARSAAERAWRVHLDLLNDLDELNMCKRAMRLSIEGEDLSQLADAELNAIVHPIDVASSFMDHGAKQAMALANLRRHSSTLRYLKNQSSERTIESAASTPGKDPDADTCVLCLSSFDEGTRAVLACGHSFHSSPCLERLVRRSGGAQMISCPLRCTVRTKREEVMVAAERREEENQRADTKVQGSWGTKVTRLVADAMEVSSRGEKSIIFSMWEDMLDVVEEALHTNRVSYVRATSLARIAESTKRFRSSDCTVLLLNVKNGAEGLNIVEATHIFMVEPLLNCGLDLQGKLEERNDRVCPALNL
jgi:SNF2 family DNA or RNA helicase